jgi:hypothetical protein
MIREAVQGATVEVEDLSLGLGLEGSDMKDLESRVGGVSCFSVLVEGVAVAVIFRGRLTHFLFSFSCFGMRLRCDC